MPARWKASPSSSGPGNLRTEAGQVRVRAAAVEDLAERRDAAVEPERVEAAQRLVRRPRDLEADDAPARAHDARELAQAAPRRRAGCAGRRRSWRRRRSRRRTASRWRRRAPTRSSAASSPARLARGAAQHLGREVEAGHLTAATHELRQLERQVAGAAARVEHGRAAPDAALARRERAPAPVEPGRHDAVHEVVGTGDAVEHALDLGRLEAVADAHCGSPPAAQQVVLDAEQVERLARDEVDRRRRACRAACRTRASQAVSAHRPGAA